MNLSSEKLASKFAFTCNVYRYTSASLMECMAGAEGCSQMLESHRAHLRGVRGNAPLSALVDALRRLKAETADAEDELAV